MSAGTTEKSLQPEAFMKILWPCPLSHFQWFSNLLCLSKVYYDYPKDQRHNLGIDIHDSYTLGYNCNNNIIYHGPIVCIDTNMRTHSTSHLIHEHRDFSVAPVDMK